MSFQEQLHKLRKEKGLSQEKLAEVIGISRQAVAKWEVGHSYPDVAKLIALSEFFKVSIDKLVNDYEENCRLHIEEDKEKCINEDITQFLCTAKKSIKSQYAEGNLKYIDTHLGGEQFIGEEAVWKDDIPIWVMNYNGRIIGEGFSQSFLNESLALVSKKYPYRGPMVYQNGQYKYHCIVNGEFEWFNGHEEIFFNDTKVYEGIFHGGRIK